MSITVTHTMTRSEFLAKSAELGGPIIVGNEFGRFDVALPSFESESYDTMEEAQEQMLLGMGLGEFPAFFIMLADGGYTKVTLTGTVMIGCLLCEGSGETKKWEVCQECDGRCEVQYANGYDGGGWPIWEYSTCKTCSGTGGADVTRACGSCSGDGRIEIDRAALTAKDSVMA